MKKRILSLLLALILVLSLLPTTALAGPSITVIDSVAAFVQYPIAGGHPDPYHGGIATEDDVPYYVDEIHFFEIDENGIGMGKFLTEEYTFVAGQTYLCEVFFKPKENYTFESDSFFGTVNRRYPAEDDCNVYDDGYGVYGVIGVYLECAAGTVTVTFDANGSADQPPAPIQVPIHGRIWDAVRNFDAVRMPDQDYEKFVDWSEDPFATETGNFSFDYDLVDQNMTLYAMWKRCEQSVDLYVEVPDDCFTEDVYGPTVVTPERANYHVSRTDNFYIGLVDGCLHYDLVYVGPFTKGQTYYSEVVVDVDVAGELPDVNLHGAELIRTTKVYGEDKINILFSVTPSASASITKASCYIETPRAGQSALRVKPELVNLTPGLMMDIVGWYETNQPSGVYYEGTLEAGKTYYALINIGGYYSQYNLSYDNLQLELYGINVRLDHMIDLAEVAGFPNIAGAMVAVTIPKQHTFSAEVPNGGGRIRSSREDGAWQNILDFTYEEGPVTLEAKPDPGREFEGWYDNSGTLVSADRLYTFNLDRNVSLKARFKNANVPIYKVDFDGRGFDTPPDPIQVPEGMCVADFISWEDASGMADADGYQFFWWGEAPYVGRDQIFDFSTPIYGNMTLFAIYLEELDSVSVYVEPPFAGSSSSIFDVTAPKMAGYEAEGTAWWTSEDQIWDPDSISPGSSWRELNYNTKYTGYFQSGETYYGAVKLRIPESSLCAFPQDEAPEVELLGGDFVAAYRLTYDVVYVVFSVTIGSPGGLSQATILVEPPVVGSTVSDNSGKTNVISLTQAISASTDNIWWDYLGGVGDPDLSMFTTPFRSGQTYYSSILVTAPRNYTLFYQLFNPNLLGGPQLLRVESGGRNAALVYFSYTYPEAYCFTLTTEPDYGGGWVRSDFSTRWDTLMDFAFVEQGEHTLTAKAEEGYHFEGWYDGQTGALVSTENPYTFYLDSDTELEAKFAPGAPREKIEEIHLNVMVPANGTVYTNHYKTEYTILDADPHYDIKSVSWYKYGSTVEENMVFTAGENYNVEFKLRPKEGYQITGDTKVYINGLYSLAKQVGTADLWRASSSPYTVLPFVDVKSSDFFYEAVVWALYHDPQITKGTDETHFSPKKACSRADVVTFLWRAKGCPEPTLTQNPFTDIKTTAYYYKAVLWAVENGITAGTTATTFSPKKTCTRGQVVTFLWRAAGSPEPTQTTHPFTDVSESAYYYKAMLWAVEQGITNGLTPTTFGPNKDCNRGQVVTFLFRAFGPKG